MYLFDAGKVEVETLVAPSLDFTPGRALRFAVSFDDQTPQIIEVPRQTDGFKWGNAVQDGVYKLRSSHNLTVGGYHTLKVWMVDPGVALQKIVVNTGGVKPSYLGPPESFYRGEMGVVQVDTFKTPPPPRYYGNAAKPSPRNDPNSMLAHQQLVEKAKKGGIDLYFLGDSITRRWGTTDAQWSPMLENWKKNFYGWNAANFGWGADGISNILWRIQNGELDGVNPKVIVILAGTNNVGTTAVGQEKVDDIVRGIRALIDTSQQKAPEAKIIVTGIFPRNDSFEVWPETQKINERIAKFADGQKIFYLNVNDKLASPDGILFDGMMGDKLHPTVKGYQVWADGLRPILTQLLGPPATTDHAPPPTGDPSATKPAPTS